MLTGILIGSLIAAAVLAWRSLFRVEEGHVGIRVAFGAARRRDGGLETAGPGLHWKWPWERVVRVSLMERGLELSGQERGRQVMADDGTVLRVDSVVRFRPRRDALDAFLFGMTRPAEHVAGLFTCLLRSELANVRAADDAHDGALEDASAFARVRRERGHLGRVVEEATRAELAERLGVSLLAIDLIGILPPDELGDALNAVISAQTEAEARLFRAQADSHQRVLAAEEALAIARARAEAAATEVRVLGRHLAALEGQGVLEDYVARRRAEVLSAARTVYVKEGR